MYLKTFSFSRSVWKDAVFILKVTVNFMLFASTKNAGRHGATPSPMNLQRQQNSEKLITVRTEKDYRTIAGDVERATGTNFPEIR